MEQLWLAEPNFIKNYLEKIENATAEDRQQAEAFFNDEKLSQESEHPDILSFSGETAFVKIEGILSRTGPSWIDQLFGFNGTAYNDIIESLKIASENDQIKIIRLLMDTPGGRTNGVDETFQAVLEAKKHKKVVAENHGMIASAGYWIAVGASQIVATAPSNETGSIGTVIALLDISKMLEKEGIKQVTIVSKNAPNKWPDISKKSGRDVLQQRVDANERVFISRIAQGRRLSEEHVIKNFGQGALLIAQDPDNDNSDALSVGMIDAITASGALGKNTNQASVKAQVANGVRSPEVTSNKQPKKEKKAMNLIEAIAEHPGIDAEVKAKEKASFNLGKQTVSDQYNAMIGKVKGYLGADSKYPKAIQGLALKVLSGESNIDAFEGAVTAFDAALEQAAGAIAADETTAHGDTPPTPPAVGADDGVVKSNEELTAAADRLKS